MASKAAREKNRKLVEKYMNEHQLEKVLNDVINSCVKEKPADPFASMAQMLKEHSSSAAGIITVAGSEVLDGRGRPTLQVTIETNRGFFSAMSPSGSAPLGGEGGARAAAVHLLDGQDDRFSGEGVLKAVKLVNEQIAPMLVGMNPTDQSAIDRALIDFDGTSSLSKLGANTLLAISFCCARAGAAEKEVPLFQHIADLAGCKDLCLPVPIFTAISGGRLSSNNLNYQEIQICPIGAKDVTEAVRMGAETFRALREAVEERFGWQAALVTDQGTLAPPMANIEDAIDSVCQAIEKAGHSTDAVKLAIVVGASELTMKPGSSEGGDGDNEAAADAATDEAVDAEEGGKAQEEAGKPQQYNMATFNKDAGEDQIVDSNELYEDYRALLEKYPDLIVSLEDPFGRKDWSAFSRLTSEFGENLQVLGDELFTSNAELIAKGVETSACNAALVRPNQLGTVSDIIRTSQLAQGSGWGICLAAADGESTDDFAADLNVGLQMGQLKIGAPCRGENVAKLNRLIRIEEECIDKRLDVSFAGTRFRYPVS